MPVIAAPPKVLTADHTHNPWVAKYGLSDWRIHGTVTSAVEDAEGNVFTPDRMHWDPFLVRGYLDIDHGFFNHGLEEAVVGVPEAVYVYPDHVEVTFRLLNRPDAQAIYEYVKAHPNELGFSIAGPLQKALLERNGTWPGIECVAITHAPINAETNAVALSAQHFRLVWQTVQALSALADPPTSLGGWRQWFLTQGWDWWTAHRLSLWASTYWPQRGQSTPTTTRQWLLSNLLVDPQDLEAMRQRIAHHLRQYRRTHPHDPHFQPDGRFYSLADAVAHFRHCEGFTKEQVAHILGIIRNQPTFIIHPPAAQFTRRA